MWFHFLLCLLLSSYSLFLYPIPASHIIIPCLSPLSVFFSFHLFDSHLLSISLILSSPLTPLPHTSMPLSFSMNYLLSPIVPSSSSSLSLPSPSFYPSKLGRIKNKKEEIRTIGKLVKIVSDTSEKKYEDNKI